MSTIAIFRDHDLSHGAWWSKDEKIVFRGKIKYSIYIGFRSKCAGRDSSVELSPARSDLLRAERSGDRIPAEARFPAPVQTGPRGPPSLLYNGYRVFPGG